MRALSLTQPWAWLVVHGGKNIENRCWNTKKREPFLIHAAKCMKSSDFDAAWETTRAISQRLAWRLLDVKHGAGFERGGIIGVADLVGVVAPLTGQQIEFGERQYEWHLPEQFGFVLTNVRPLPFLPCKGSLGFWGEWDIVDGKAVQR